MAHESADSVRKAYHLVAALLSLSAYKRSIKCRDIDAVIQRGDNAGYCPLQTTLFAVSVDVLCAVRRGQLLRAECCDNLPKDTIP